MRPFSLFQFLCQNAAPEVQHLFLDAGHHLQERAVLPAGGVIQTPVLPVSAGQERAVDPAAHGDHDVHRGQLREGLVVLGQLHVHAVDMLHQAHRVGVYPRAGLGAGGKALEHVCGQLFAQRLRHLAAAGIVHAEEGHLRLFAAGGVLRPFVPGRAFQRRFAGQAFFSVHARSPLFLLLNFIGPGVDAAKLADAGVAQFRQRGGRGLAAVAAAAVDQHRGALFGNDGGGGVLVDGAHRQQHRPGDVALVVFALFPHVQHHRVPSVHHLFGLFLADLPVGRVGLLPAARQHKKAKGKQQGENTFHLWTSKCARGAAAPPVFFRFSIIPSPARVCQSSAKGQNIRPPPNTGAGCFYFFSTGSQTSQ